MGKRCLQSRPRGPSAKRQPSPEGLGLHRQAVERRRCGTTLFVCSLGAKRFGDLSHNNGLYGAESKSLS